MSWAAWLLFWLRRRRPARVRIVRLLYKGTHVNGQTFSYKTELRIVAALVDADGDVIAGATPPAPLVWTETADASVGAQVNTLDTLTADCPRPAAPGVVTYFVNCAGLTGDKVTVNYTSPPVAGVKILSVTAVAAPAPAP